MVLFNDDIIEEKKERSRLNKWVRRIIKISLILGITLFLSLTVLSSLGGQHEQLKRGLEDYMTSATGYKTTIGALNYMGFYPQARVDVSNVTMDTPGAGDLRIGRIAISIDFWDLAFSRMKYNAFYFQDIIAPAGAVSPKAFYISKLGLIGHDKDGANYEISAEVPARRGADKIDSSKVNTTEEAVDEDVSVAETTEPQKTEAKKTTNFTVLGRYGQHDIYFAVEMMTREKNNGMTEFSVPKLGAYDLSFGAFKSSGQYDRSNGAFTFIFDKAGIGEDQISGKLKPFLVSGRTGIEGRLHFGDSSIEFDVDQNATDLAGEVSFDVLDFADLKAPLSIIDQLSAYIGSTEKSEDSAIEIPYQTMDLSISAKEIRNKGKNLGHINVPVTMENGIFRIGQITGKFADGSIDSNMTLTQSSEHGWDLKLKGSWRKWNYAKLLDALRDTGTGDGQTNTTWDLTAKGKNKDELVATLTGKISLLGGASTMPSRALNIWGGGVINALVPSLDPDSEARVNCAIANFDVLDGIATPEPLFLDTKRVTIVAEGNVDLKANKLDLKLVPNSKDTALLDVSPAVNVKGSILKPDIGISTSSLLGKIGGLALGAINPAFLLLTTDLGLTEDHPCHQYIEDPAGKVDVKKADKTPDGKVDNNEDGLAVTHKDTQRKIEQKSESKTEEAKEPVMKENSVADTDAATKLENTGNE